MEELDLEGTVRRLDGLNLSPIERVLAAHTGTVQLLVSLWFADPADAIVKHQSEHDGVIQRQVALTLRTSLREVCLADTEIPIADNSPKVLALVRAQGMGIGQVAVYLGIPTLRRILDIQVLPQDAVDVQWCLKHSRQGVIVRRYDMSGPGLHYLIQETFPRLLYWEGDRLAVLGTRLGDQMSTVSP